MTGQAETFFDEVAKLHSVAGYEPIDRYREFRAVFLDDERGRRVLREILGWTHLHRSSVSRSRPLDPYLTHFHEGEASIGRAILKVLHTEPTERPASAITQEPKE